VSLVVIVLVRRLSIGVSEDLGVFTEQKRVLRLDVHLFAIVVVLVLYEFLCTHFAVTIELGS
jgi:hypothetical protein